MVFAGFVITNSETGCGAFTLTPRLVVQVCRNGMTITRDAIRAVHLGERLDEGVVTWSEQHPATSPSPRAGAALVWDPATRKLLLIRGRHVPGQLPFLRRHLDLERHHLDPAAPGDLAVAQGEP